MSYVWNAEGAVYLFPTCYRTENRVLILRATLLFALAAALFWISLVGPDAASLGPALLRPNVRPGSPEPHFYAGLLLMLIGIVDIVLAARQRHVRLLAGQPAPLALPLPHHASGASPGAGWLSEILSTGRVPAAGLAGKYQRALRVLLPKAAFAPTTLQSFARVRIANLLFTGGLLAALALTWTVAATQPALPLAATLLGVLALAQVAYSAWIAREAPSPRILAAALTAGCAAALAVSLVGGSVPHLARLQPYAMPKAVAVLLVGLLLVDLLAALAARAQTNLDLERAQAPCRAMGATVSTDPARLMEDVDRELLRRYTDGVANRRYLRRAPQDAMAAAETTVALEETQPALPAEHREELPAQPLARRTWLLALAAMALLVTLAGGVMWVVMAHALLANGASPWTDAATALALVLVGGYAVRAGHLLWSRIEVESTMFEVAISSAPGAGEAGREGESVSRLHVRALRARSCFYAAGEHALGSRSLCRVTPADDLAESFVKQVQAMAVRQVAPAAPKARNTGERAAEPNPAPARPKLPARYCSSCGTPLLQGARFCQHCGADLDAR